MLFWFDFLLISISNDTILQLIDNSSNMTLLVVVFIKLVKSNVYVFLLFAVLFNKHLLDKNKESVSILLQDVYDKSVVFGFIIVG